MGLSAETFCMVEIELVSMGPPTEWGPGQIALVASPLLMALARWHLISVDIQRLWSADG